MTDKLDQVINAADRILLGKRRVIRVSLACLLAGGHLLIEDVPGVGKTTLAQLLGLHINGSSSPATCCPRITWGFLGLRSRTAELPLSPGLDTHCVTDPYLRT